VLSLRRPTIRGEFSSLDISMCSRDVFKAYLRGKQNADLRKTPNAVFKTLACPDLALAPLVV